MMTKRAKFLIGVIIGGLIIVAMYAVPPLFVGSYSTTYSYKEYNIMSKEELPASTVVQTVSGVSNVKTPLYYLYMHPPSSIYVEKMVFDSVKVGDKCNITFVEKHLTNEVKITTTRAVCGELILDRYNFVEGIMNKTK